MHSKTKIIGILGGMGPEATLFFYEKIIKFTKANKDQEHIPTLIFSNTKIPDRTNAILKKDHKRIIKELTNTAKILEKSGAKFIVIPCNTAHYYINEIRRSVKIPVLDMIEETAKYISKKNKKIGKNIGLLATKGTLSTEIYQNKFKDFGINILIPKKETQEKVMKAIYDIKANGPSKESRKLIDEAIKELREENKVKLIILGCTELPLLFKKSITENIKRGIIDPMDILAKKAILKAGGKIK